MTTLSRRSLFRAAAGLGVALPWLESLSGFAHAQAMTPPKRLLLVFTPNGTLYDEWRPAGTTGPLTLSPLLQPLSAHLSKLTVIDGLDLESAKHGPGDGHQPGIGTLWTGIELLPGSFGGGNGMTSGWAGGPSVDQIVAQQLNPSTLLRSLELGVGADTQENHGRMIFQAANSPVSFENNPQAAFDRLFGNGVVGDPQALAKLRARRKKVVDVVRAQVQRVRPRVSSTDRMKLDQHLAALSGLEASLNAPIDLHACTVPGRPADPGGAAGYWLTHAGYPQTCSQMMALATQAFACDLTRIASIQFDHSQGDNVFTSLGHTEAHHELSHSLPADTAGNAKLRQINLWYAQRMAELLDGLAAVPEGSGTMLDSTLVVWGNELNTGWNHVHDRMPFVLAGGLIAGGRLLQASGPHNKLLVSIAQLMGATQVSQIGNPMYGTGPLAGL